jgi:hypothetical protein
LWKYKADDRKRRSQRQFSLTPTNGKAVYGPLIRKTQQNLGWKNIELRAHLKDLGIHGNIILINIYFKRECEVVDWINVDQGRNMGTSGI